MRTQTETVDPKLEKALESLKKNFGITKGKERLRLTKEEKEKIAEALHCDPKEQKKLFKEFGLF